MTIDRGDPVAIMNAARELMEDAEFGGSMMTILNGSAPGGPAAAIDMVGAYLERRGVPLTERTALTSAYIGGARAASSNALRHVRRGLAPIAHAAAPRRRGFLWLRLRR